MTLRNIALAILFSPIIFGVLFFTGLMVVLKLPMLYCSRWRRVRYLPLAGSVYYGLLVPLVAEVGEPLAWWEILLLVRAVVCGGNWLVPDPFTYFFNPRKRRAVARAIEFVEATNRVIYGMVNVIGREAGRTIVSVALQSECTHPGRRFLAVADDGETVEVLDFDYVAANFGVRGRF